MLSGAVRILNFDDSVLKQQNLISLYNPQILDLKDIGGFARGWLDKKTKDDICKRISFSSRNSVTFLGSGDYHHISSLLIGKFNEPINLIIFDHHPDWDIFPPKFGYGSWVNRVLERNNVLKIIYLGVSSEDISNLWIQSGNLNSLKSSRVEIYPYSHKPTKVFFRNVPQNASFQLQRGLFLSVIRWEELRSHNLVDFLSGILKGLAVEQTYVSIDKDCLKAEYSLTNWEEGFIRLDDLLAMLKLIKENLDIVGLDITGDYSKPQVSGSIKKICSCIDHPKDYTARGKTSAEITLRNEQTNIAIINALRD